MTSFVGPDGNPNYDFNYALYLYLQARGNQKEMQLLIQEPHLLNKEE